METITLTLDMKKGRIRIHKSTLDKLNHPHHILLLINPTTMKFAINPCEENIKDALKITYKSEYECEIYSTELITQLSILKPTLSNGKLWRLNGKIINNSQIALFDINSLTQIES